MSEQFMGRQVVDATSSGGGGIDSELVARLVRDFATLGRALALVLISLLLRESRAKLSIWLCG